MRRYTQAEKTKLIVQDVIEIQRHGVTPRFITDILSKKGLDTSTYYALSELAGKSVVKRVDLYNLFYPYNSTEHGKIMYIYMIGLRGKKNIKASVRNLFSQLVCREHVMEASPALVYEGRQFMMM